MSVSYDLPAGTFVKQADGTLPYTLQAEPQSLFIPSTLTVQVTAPAGWSPVPQPGMEVNGSMATVSGVQNAPINVAMQFQKAP